MQTGATMSVTFEFASETVELKLMSHDEFVALLEVARGPVETSSSDLRELARIKLGKTLAFGYEATIDALPDRLEPDERVERVAIGTAEFTGMLVVTDRRVLLVDRGLRAERFWEAPRDDDPQARAGRGRPAPELRRRRDHLHRGAPARPSRRARRGPAAMIRLVRYGLPAAILVAGVVLVIIGGDAPLGAGIVLIGVAGLVVLANVMMQLSVQSERDREREAQRREERRPRD